jgi:alpha-glucosidase (family GH31 glycosyl hydrolase)
MSIARRRVLVTRTAGLSTGLIVASLLTGVSAAADPGSPQFTQTKHAITIGEPAQHGSPAYTITVNKDPLQITTSRGSRTVLATTTSQSTSASRSPVTFTAGGSTYAATRVIDSRWASGKLTLRLATTNPGYQVAYNLTPHAGQYQVAWTVTGNGAGSVDSVGENYTLASAGYWYGQGLTTTPQGGPITDQPWPLNAGDVNNQAMGPSSHDRNNPFWYTSSSTGLWVNTNNNMNVQINHGQSGLGSFTVTATDTYNSTVFVESTPRSVYLDYIAVTGTPRTVDDPRSYFATPTWNSWAEFHTSVTEESFLAYVHQLADNHIPGHAIQIDDGWTSNYGDYTFDPVKFPTPKEMSAEVHSLGFDLGLWMTMWINKGSANYDYAKDHGYFFMSKANPNEVCLVPWWNGEQGAGIVDLANPAARDWFSGIMHDLMSTYDVNGFKFDTRFYDPSCAPDPGYTTRDYLELAHQFADDFDMEGLGVTAAWTGTQRYGFAMRDNDKGTDWHSFQASLAQVLALTTVGYPFVETDMIGGSSGSAPPTKEVLIRWAQAAALMPLEYASTSPANPRYDQETIDLYRAAMTLHERLTPYILKQLPRAVQTGEPIMKPIFFNFPEDRASYTISNEWLLGDSLLAAPVDSDTTVRDIDVPAGQWYDVSNHRVVHGPTTLRAYRAGLAQVPMFVRLGTPDTGMLMSALHGTGRKK